MRIGLKFITPVLAAGAAAVALAAAPTAGAEPQQQGPRRSAELRLVGSATICQKPGDAEINSSIPAPYPGVYGIYGPFWAG